MLLAVLAGYAVLLAVNQVFSQVELRRSHQQRVEELIAYLDMRMQGSGSLEEVLDALPTFVGVQVGLAGALPSPSGPGLLRTPGGVWLVTTTLFTLPNGSRQPLLVREDVTAQLERQSLIQWLLVAAAGVSSLFTSTLVRLLLQRGLTRPLERFSEQLASTPLPPATWVPMQIDQQPQELQRIAVAFNAVLARLASTWDQQRLFVDGVAHELRTPITLISGYSQSLQRRLSALGPAGSELVEPMQRLGLEADRLGVLVDELLTLARSDAGRLELNLVHLDLDSVLVEAYERLLPLSGARLQLKPPLTPVAAWVRADPERLQQCVGNLVLNALHYTPAGTPIELFSSTTAEEAILHVRDHGPGVPVAERERIFERFVRGSGSSTASGSGLGLPLVRLLMQEMGGTVRLTAAPGGGAEFQLRLPFVQPDLSFRLAQA